MPEKYTVSKDVQEKVADSFKLKRNQLSDLEFIIDRYSEQYLVPLFNQCAREIRKKRDREMDKATRAAIEEPISAKIAEGLSSGELNFNPLTIDKQTYKTGHLSDLHQDFTNTNKTTDDIIQDTIDKAARNYKIGKDLELLTIRLAAALSGNNFYYEDPKEAKKWESKAQAYLENRIQRTFVNFKVGRDMPKSAVEYFLKKSLKTGTYAMLYKNSLPYENLYKSGGFADDVENRTGELAREKYNISYTTDFLITSGLQFFEEIPIWGGVGKGVTGALKGARSWVAWDAGMGTLNGSLFYHANNSTQRDFSFKNFGTAFWLDKIEKKGMETDGHDANFINGIIPYLSNSIDLSQQKTFRESLRKDFNRNLLRQAHGSNQRLRQLIRDEIIDSNDKMENCHVGPWAYDREYFKWMENVKWEECHRRAAYWASQLHNMAEYGIRKKKFGSTEFSIDQVAERAISYANAAVHNLKTQQNEANLKKDTVSICNDIIRKSGGSPAKTRDFVRQGLYKVGLYAGIMDNNIPAWMRKMNHNSCQKQAAWFIARAQAVKNSGGNEKRYKELAQKAWYYAQAACTNLKTEQEKHKNSVQIGNYKQQFLSQAHGSNQKLRRAIRAEISKDSHLRAWAKSNDYEPWMKNCSWQNLHRNAAYWAAALRKMNTEHLDTMTFCGKKMRKWDVAKRAIGYINAANDRLVSSQKSERNNKSLSESINKLKPSLLKQAGGNNKKLHTLINKELSGSYSSLRPSVPKWMSSITSANCRADAAYYCAVAKWMKTNHASYVKIGGRNISLKEAIIRSCQYATAAELNVNVRIHPKTKSQKRSASKGVAVKATASQSSINKEVISKRDSLLSRSKGSNYDLRKIIRAEIDKESRLKSLSKNNHYDLWMKNVSWQQCRRMAAFYAGELMYARAHGYNYISISGKTYSRAQLAERAVKYANAAIDNLENSQKNTAKTKGKGRGHTPRSTTATPSPKPAAPRTTTTTHNHGNDGSPHTGTTKHTTSRSTDKTSKIDRTTPSHTTTPANSVRTSQKNNGRGNSVTPKSTAAPAAATVDNDIQGADKNINSNNTTMATQGLPYSDASVAEREVSRYGHKEITAPADETIHPAQVQNRNNCFIVMSKKDYYCYVYEKRGNENVMVARYDCAFGVNKGDKTRQGDGKTPSSSMEHPFHIQSIESSKDWKHDFHDGRGEIRSYGDWFLRLSLDGHKLQGNKSIGIHGSTNNSESVPGRASEGCIRLKDEDIRDLKEHYAFKGMKVIIKDESEDDLPFEVEAMRKQGITRRRHYSNGRSAAPAATQAQDNTRTDTRSQGNAITYNDVQNQGQGQYMGGSRTPGSNGILDSILGQSTPWGQYINSVLPHGFSDVFKHIGYVMAMLPDLLIGIFTGRTGFSLKNNLMPIGLVAMALFMSTKKHPLLKLMLLGLAGATILNNAGHRIIREGGLEDNKRQPLQRYKVYNDEPLNPRIKNPVVKGNMMLADIDGVPNVIAISSMAIDAYEKKALPLNTLANAVLAKYDEQKENIANNVTQQVGQQEKVSQEAVLK